VLFDRAVDEAFELLGCGLDYGKTRRHSCFTAEVHVRYLRELHAGDPVRVTFQLLEYDAKRMYYFEQLFHAAEAGSQQLRRNMSLHVDMAAGKTVPFPGEIARCFARMMASHAALPRPEAAGPTHRDARLSTELSASAAGNTGAPPHSLVPMPSLA